MRGIQEDQPVAVPVAANEEGGCGLDRIGLAGVDHFIPWARCADNGLDNLVVTHQRCNNQKRDFLAAADHVEQLVARNGASGGQLDDIARQEAWTRDGARSRAVGRALYSRLPGTARVWLRGQDLVPIERERVLTALR